MHASINEGCLAGALALAGQNSDAGKAVEAAGTWHYESVAVSLAERGRPQEALKLARRIDSPPGRSSALIRISEKLPLADQRAVLDEAQTYDGFHKV
jgi:hypothetical protein